MSISVAFVVDNLHVGGTELNAVRTAELLVANGATLSVFAMQADGALRARYGALDIEVIPIPLGGSLAGVSAVRQGFRFARQLRGLRVGILHCHDRYSNVFGAFWGRRVRGVALITSRRWDQREGPVVLRGLNRLAFRTSDAVVGNSERVCRALAAEDGVPPHRIAHIPNFVETEAFRPPSPPELRRWRQACGMPVDRPVVGMVANLRPVKDHRLFLEAAGLVARADPDVHFAIIGEGEERARLERQAAELGLAERVHFLGLLPNRPNPYHLVDIAALTSRAEGFPNSILEAMAAARPVVATAVGGVPDAVADGVTGLLVPPGAPDPLAAAILALLRDPRLARQLGVAGERVARERYGSARILADLNRLYDRVLTDRL